MLEYDFLANNMTHICHGVIFIVTCIVVFKIALYREATLLYNETIASHI